jgi:hypothetical protein
VKHSLQKAPRKGKEGRTRSERSNVAVKRAMGVSLRPVFPFPSRHSWTFHLSPPYISRLAILPSIPLSYGRSWSALVPRSFGFIVD